MKLWSSATDKSSISNISTRLRTSPYSTGLIHPHKGMDHNQIHLSIHIRARISTKYIHNGAWISPSYIHTGAWISTKYIHIGAWISAGRARRFISCRARATWTAWHLSASFRLRNSTAASNCPVWSRIWKHNKCDRLYYHPALDKMNTNGNKQIDDIYTMFRKFWKVHFHMS